MKEFMENIRLAMIEHGAIGEKYRIKFVEEQGNKNSDYRTIVVECFYPRCRKPFAVWNLKIDMVRELLFWDKSSFYYL